MTIQVVGTSGSNDEVPNPKSQKPNPEQWLIFNKSGSFSDAVTTEGALALAKDMLYDPKYIGEKSIAGWTIEEQTGENSGKGQERQEFREWYHEHYKEDEDQASS
jgi:hypothetical protein